MAAPRVSNRMPRLGRANPGRRHLSGADVTAKMQRQYEHVLDSLRHRHKYRSDAKRKQVAAATVRKLAGENRGPTVRTVYIVEFKEGKKWVDSGAGEFLDSAEAIKLAKESGRDWRIIRAKPRAQGNPSWFGLDDESRAEQLAEEFHGRPARQFLDVEEEETYTDYGAVLGCLQGLKILMDDGDDYIPIEFDFEPGSDENILVVADPAGHNIEFVGGDQDIDWQKVDGASEADKHLVLVGPVMEIEYFADKHHLSGPNEQKSGITYYHEFGDEGGELPYLVFDRRNRKLWFVGGSYTIEPEGIAG